MPDAFPKVLNLIGTSKPTLSKLYIQKDPKNSFSFLYSDGDGGTVPIESAKLPKVFRNVSTNREIQFPGKHRKLFNEKIAKQEISDFLKD